MMIDPPENVSVYVNCKKAEFDGFGGLDENITRLNGYRFRIDKDTEFIETNNYTYKL